MRPDTIGLMAALLVIAAAACCQGADAPAAQTDKASGAANTPAKLQWKNVYRHETGISFRYPDGWTYREDSNLQAVFLLPDDARGGGLETIMVSGADSQGVTDSSDPRLLEAIEALVLQGNPLMKRVEKPLAVKAGNRPGTQFIWEATDIVGNTSRIRVMSTVLDKYVVSVTVFGPKARVVGRESIQKQIFDTLDLSVPGSATQDAAAKAGSEKTGPASTPAELAGTWMKMDYKAVGGSSWTKYTYATLRPDGSVLISDSSESAHNFQYKNQQGNEVARAVGGSQGASGSVGRWKAEGGTLTITFAAGGSDQYGYQIRPNSSGWPILYLRPSGGGKVQEWSKSN